MTVQFAAKITCAEDPCTYCHRPARSDILDKEFQIRDTPEEALAFGRGMSRNVYGASAHRVAVVSRTTTPWEDHHQ